MALSPSSLWAAHRRLAILGFVIAGLVVVLGLAHTPFVRGRLLAYAVARVRADVGIRAQIDNLHYNLFTLRASLGHTSLAASDEAPPFLEFDSFSVDVPWSIVTGRIAIQSLEIVRPRITVNRDLDGELNLPVIATASEPAPASEPLGPIDVGRLVIRDLEVGYADRPLELSIDGKGATLDMSRADGSPLSGRLTVSDGIRLKLGDRETALSKLDAGLSFDGSALTIDELTADAPEIQLRVDGRVDLLAAAPVVEVRFQGSTLLERLAPWVAPGENLSGALDFSGTATGALDAPGLTLALSATDLGWRDQRGMALDLRSDVTASAATIERLRLTLGGGAIEGRARIGLGDPAASHAELTWTGLDLGSIARTAGVDQVRITTAADGKATADWTGTDLQTATAAIETALNRGRAPAGALPIDGRVKAALDRGRWTLGIDGLSTRTVRLDGDATGRLNADDLTATTLSGQVRTAVDDLNALLAELRAAGIELPADSALDGGRASAEVALSGTVGAPAARGTLEATVASVNGVGPSDLTASFTADLTRVAVEPLRLTLGPDTVNGDLAIDLGARTLRGSLDADLPRLSPLSVMLPPESRLEGAASLHAGIGGTLDNPLVELTATVTDLEAAGQRVERVDLAARLADQVLRIERFDLTQDDGQLGVTGSYALDSGRYSIVATGRGLAVTPVVTAGEPLPVQARLDLEITGEGTLEAPRARATIDVRDLIWGDYVLGGAHLDATAAADGLHLDANLPALKATVKARAALNAPRRFTADVAVDRAEINSLIGPNGPGGAPAPDDAAAAAVPLTGAITLAARAAGDLDSPSDAVVDLDLRLIDVTAGGAPVRLDRPARLRYEAGHVTAEDFALRIGDATTVTAAGRFGDAADPTGLTVNLKGGPADFLPFARMVSGLEKLDAAGAIEFQMHASGTFDAPRVNAALTVADASVSMPDLPAATDIRLRASFDDGLLTLGELGAAWQGATLSASGTVPITILGDRLPETYVRTLPRLPDRARAEVRLDSVTAAVAAPFVDAATLGRLAANLAATAVIEATSIDLDGIQADVTFDRAELEMAGAPINQERPTKLRLADGRLDVVDWSWSGSGNRLTIAGGARLAGESPELQASLGGSLDLRMLGAFSPDLASGGRADFDFRANGPLTQPVVEGELRLQEGELAIRDPRFAVTDLRGTVAVTADRVRFLDIQALANGGTLQLSGDVELQEFAPSGGSLEIVGRGLALEVPENLRSEVNLDLTFTVSPEAPALSGKVTVLRGSYRAPISLTGQLLSSVEVVPAVPAEPGLADRIRLSVSVVTDEGIIIDNNYGRLEIESDLKVVGTTAQPALAGRLTIREGGAVFLAGQTWSLERGTVDFTSATRIEPNLDLLLSTRVQQYEVSLSVSGTPETLEASLTSPEGLSQADAVSLLLTGQRADPGTVAQADIARGQLLLLLSGELLGFAGRAIGLDSAQVSRGLGGAASDFDLLATETDPSARLTLSKALRRDVEVIFSQSLRNSDDLTWIAVYRPIRGIELRATTSGDNSRAYEFRNELTFGGGVARRASARREPAPRVSAVRLTGTPGFDEREVRDRVKLKEGDRFDFFRWQQDRDRLADFYHERGYLEARIRSARDTRETPEGEPAIALTYDIERGAATSLAVEGASLPGGVIESMRETWARAVFDGFLRDDLERIAKRSLAEDGYLRAEAHAEFRADAAAGTKQIVVRLTPGTRYTDRRLVFEGERTLSAEELDAILQTRQLTQTAWLRPADVEAALVALYRSRGLQSARVNIEPPVFSESTARLPVEVIEGPQFRIASVDIEGVSARPIEEVRKAFGIEPGAPYVPLALETARRDVEIDYLHLGYNDVRVSVTSTAHPDDPSARITVQVQEGQQQVLQGVSLSGANITTPGTVRRALDLKIGEPADLSDLYRAQKRLYDTGVFQRAEIVLEPTGEAGAAGTEPVRAAVTLEEVPPYRLRYGVRLADDTGPVEADREFRPGFVVDFLRRNLFGRALSAGVAGQIEADRRLARGILSTPQFFGLPVTSSLYLTQSRQDFTPEGFTPFVEDGSEVTAEQRFRPRSDMAVSYDYRFKRSRVFEPSAPAGLPTFDVQVNVARLTGTFAWDTRDDPFNARRGSFLSTGLESGVASLGSDLRFIKLIVQQFYFRPVGQSVVLASAARLGAARGFDQELIPSERFFVGGGTSVRGFAEDGLGSVDFLGDPEGGASSLIFNQEVRFPIYKWVRGVGFFDAGNVFPRARDLRPFDLEAGGGFGVRIDTPFGLARIDYGMPFTQRSRQPFGRWYFSIGQAF